MDMTSTLLGLSKLLGGSTEQTSNELDYDEYDGQATPAAAKMTPAQIGPPAKRPAPVEQKKKESKDIWDADEVPVSGYGAEEDPRLRPQYEIVYKQAVSAEDMFIGLSGRDPSTASCEDMVVIVSLPDTRKTDLELDMTPTFLDLRTPKYRLGLHLPHPVDDENGSAKFDVGTGKLRVTLPLRREYDFLRA
eukprot:m.179982 g.179982  ORF g.179982 m.179982 type:complete len:191 (-) comp53435_c0_seq3:117-689(-)